MSDAVVTNRRRFLLGLAAASAAAAGPAGGAAGTSGAVLENPALIALAAQLPAIADAYFVASAAYEEMRERWCRATPMAPDEITVPGTADPWSADKQEGTAECFATGDYMTRPGEQFPRRIVNSFYWKLLKARREKRKAKKDGAVADFLLAEAEANRLRACETTLSSYRAASAAANAAYKADHFRLYPASWDAIHHFAKHVGAIMAEEDRTMEGLLIKAEALAAWGRVDPIDQGVHAIKNSANWHGSIAASILHHAGAGRPADNEEA